MKIIIKFTNLDPTPAIREYVEEKLGSLERFLARLEVAKEAIAHVELARVTKHHKKGDVFRAETNIEMPKRMLRAAHEGPDARFAVDRVKDVLQREIKKYKALYGDESNRRVARRKALE